MPNLTAIQVRNLKKPGSYTDGDGLRLKVSKAGTKSWLYRYRLHGRQREMGLGRYPQRSLAGARREAVRLNNDVLNGIDPITERDAERQQAADAAEWTFHRCAVEFHAMKKAEWTSEQYAKLWIAAIENHCGAINDLPVGVIDTHHVMRVVEPLWIEKTTIASTLRERIESVLNWAATSGYREKGFNPASWRGHLEHKLPKKTKVHKVEHRAAMPYQEINTLMKELRDISAGSGDSTSQGLQFIILTAVRTNELVGAQWDEIDMQGRIWTIPADRMKMRVQHRVPLSDQAMELLNAQPRRDGYLFPSMRYGQNKPMCSMIMWKLLRSLREQAYTVHGFRSSFRDWIEEQTSYSRRVAEYSLAHSDASAVEAAYQRSDLLEKRRPLMQAWADYCDWEQAVADVVPIGAVR